MIYVLSIIILVYCVVAVMALNRRVSLRRALKAPFVILVLYPTLLKAGIKMWDKKGKIPNTLVRRYIEYLNCWIATFIVYPVFIYNRVRDIACCDTLKEAQDYVYWMFSEDRFKGSTPPGVYRFGDSK